MIRWLLMLILTLFQDNFVRLGILIGVVAGIWSTGFLRGELWVNSLALGFIGWGLGAYFGYHHSRSVNTKKRPKLKVHQGGR